MASTNYSYGRHRSSSGVDTRAYRSSNQDPSVVDRPPPYSSHHYPARSRDTTRRIDAEEDDEDDEAFLEETTAWIPRAPAITKTRAPELRKPVVIPRIDTVGLMTIPLPFVRAYSRDLRPFGIDEQEFIAFVDNLALAQAPPVSLQAVNFVGTAIGFVPHPATMVIGTGMNVAAGAGYFAAYKRRTRLFFEKVNKEYFAPRGLKVSICKNKELAEKLGHHPDMPALLPQKPGSEYINRRERRMQVLAPYIAPLSLDVPPPMKQRSLIDKFSAKQVKRKMKKKEKKHKKKAEKMKRKQAKEPGSRPDPDARRDSFSSASSIYSSDSDSSVENAVTKDDATDKRILLINYEAELDLRKAGPKEAAKIEEKRKKEIQKVEEQIAKEDRRAGKKTAKDGKKREKKFKSDVKTVDKMEFIVVENLVVR